MILGLKQVGTPDEKEFQLMEKYYRADIEEGKDFRRTSIERILKYWPSELDKAREYDRKNK